MAGKLAGVARERVGFEPTAEGATAPESLRQTDRARPFDALESERPQGGSTEGVTPGLIPGESSQVP